MNWPMWLLPILGLLITGLLALDCIDSTRGDQ